MPHSLLLHPPGGATGKVRKWYALIQKILLLEESNRLWRECNFSLRRAGEVLGTTTATATTMVGRTMGSMTQCSTVRRRRRRRRRRRAGTTRTARMRVMATEGRGGIRRGGVAYFILLN
jgi:hypothetical protein